MSSLKTYLEEIVEPTFDDFRRDETRRRAFLCAVAAFHAVDRAAEDANKKSGNLRKDWGEESIAFKMIDILAHSFKHVKTYDHQKPEQWNGLLSFGEVLARTPTVQFTSIIADALEFMRKKAEGFSGEPKA